MIYIVCSGMPKGEIHHREKVVALTKEAATRALAEFEKSYPEPGYEGEWVWGPGIAEKNLKLEDITQEDITIWNGHKEVPAPLYT